MTGKIGFSNQRYLREQSAAILKRAENNGRKLYLEFGGKLLYDFHAARILPGFDPNVKMHLLQMLKNKIDIILCIYAGDIERKKIRADFGITYDSDSLKLIDDLREWDLEVRAVVITRYDNQPSAKQFMDKLERRGIQVYTHCATKGYPTDIDLIVSDEGYGVNPCIDTDKPIVVVTAPGPGSGKLATCLSQLYHEHRKGTLAIYAKFETFPIWNLPLKHPVNIAYEAATADIGDFNMVDPFHLDAYGETVINYNRDVEVFPVLQRILQKITGVADFYRSPTDMGVNRAGFAIENDDIVKEASTEEVIRRYFRYKCEYTMGLTDKSTVDRVVLLMSELGVKPENRKVVGPANDAAAKAVNMKGKGHIGIYCGAAIELNDGTIVTGVNSPVMHAASSVVINAVKHVAGIPDNIYLLSKAVIESVADLKRGVLSSKTASLDLNETLITLSVSATSNPTAQLAVDHLKHLRGCEMHMTHMPTPGDEAGLRKLGLNLTTDSVFANKLLFVD